ncbi:hypothetical protein AAG906_029243 [Vitis piasezkii]
MNCHHGEFLRLEFLQIQQLWSLEDLSVEEGAYWNRIGLIISQTLETYLGTKMVSFVVYLNLSLILYQDPFVS